MVNGRILEDELQRINDYFDAMSVEEFEEMVLDCGAVPACLDEDSIYEEAIPRRYVNAENRNGCYLEEAMYTVTMEEIEAA